MTLFFFFPWKKHHGKDFLCIRNANFSRRRHRPTNFPADVQIHRFNAVARQVKSRVILNVQVQNEKSNEQKKTKKSPKVSFCMISVNVQLVVCVPRIRETQFVMPLAWCSAPQEHGLRGATGSGVGKGEGEQNVDGCNRRLSKVANSP